MGGARVDGRRFGPGKLLLLTQGRWKRSWPFVAARLVRAGTVGDKERQRSGRQRRARPRTPRRGGPKKPGPVSSSAITDGEEAGDRAGRSLRDGVNRPATWGRIAARWSGAVVRMALGLTPQHIAETVIAVREPWAWESSECRVLVSNVGCRDRCEASSRRDRGEPRGEPRERGVGQRSSSSRTRRAGARGSKGC